MNSRERVLAIMDHRPVDRFLGRRSQWNMFAGDQIRVKYRDYVRDHRLLVVGLKLVMAKRLIFDDAPAFPTRHAKAADLGAASRYFDDQPPAFDESRHCSKRRGNLPG